MKQILQQLKLLNLKQLTQSAPEEMLIIVDEIVFLTQMIESDVKFHPDGEIIIIMHSSNISMKTCNMLFCHVQFKSS